MTDTTDSASSEPTVTESSSSASFESSEGLSSSTRVVKKGTQKKEQETVEQILTRSGFTLQETREASLLRFGTSIGERSARTAVLLFSNDRAALFSWVDDPDAKEVFLTLKQELQKKFSADMRDLIDQRIVPDDSPPMDVLSFIDPNISDEQIIFVRTRTRLYEFHVAPGKEEVVRGLINELAK